MAVRIFLFSGEQRLIEAADSAHVEGPFFVVSRWYPDLELNHTILTLRTEDVIGADILRDGIKVRSIQGLR